MTVPEDRFHGMLDGWEIIPVVESGETIGAVIRKGAELHIGVTRTPLASYRRQIREVVRDTIAVNGYIVTAVRKDNRNGINFCVRLGFRVVKETEEAFYLRCERLRYD